MHTCTHLRHDREDDKLSDRAEWQAGQETDRQTVTAITTTTSSPECTAISQSGPRYEYQQQQQQRQDILAAKAIKKL